MKISELVVDVVFNADQRKLTDFIKGVGDLNMKSIMSASGLGGLYEVAKKSLEIFDEMSLGVNRFGWETGQSTEKVQKWSNFAVKMGSSAATVQQSIMKLEDTIAQMNITGASPVWGYLGIDPRRTKDYFEVLTAIREKFKGMSVEMQRYFLQQLGLSTELLTIFRATDAEWGGINQQLALSNEQLKKADEFHQSMARFGIALKQSWGDLGAAISPVILSITNMLSEAMEFWHKMGLGGGIKKAAGSIWDQLGGGYANQNPLGLPAGVKVGLPEGQRYAGPQINNNMTFNVTGDDPRKHAEFIRREIQKQNSDALYQLTR